MKKRSFARAVVYNYILIFGIAGALIVLVFGLIFGAPAVVVTIVSAPLIAVVTASAIEENLNDIYGHYVVTSSKKPMTFKLINKDGKIEIYGKKGLFWFFVNSGFDDVYKAQEYIASLRQLNKEKRGEEVGRFKA